MPDSTIANLLAREPPTSRARPAVQIRPRASGDVFFAATPNIGDGTIHRRDPPRLKRTLLSATVCGLPCPRDLR